MAELRNLLVVYRVKPNNRILSYPEAKQGKIKNGVENKDGTRHETLHELTTSHQSGCGFFDRDLYLKRAPRGRAGPP